jgi:hypothetical protein
MHWIDLNIYDFGLRERIYRDVMLNLQMHRPDIKK